jgi:hypothetical protein
MSEPMNRTPTASLDELLTVNEVADELRVDPRTIYHYLQQGPVTRNLRSDVIWPPAHCKNFRL